MYHYTSTYGKTGHIAADMKGTQEIVQQITKSWKDVRISYTWIGVIQ
jgi:hypothetical protein